jgi:hypothetical protein
MIETSLILNKDEWIMEMYIVLGFSLFFIFAIIAVSVFIIKLAYSRKWEQDNEDKGGW